MKEWIAARRALRVRAGAVVPVDLEMIEEVEDHLAVAV